MSKIRKKFKKVTNRVKAATIDVLSNYRKNIIESNLQQGVQGAEAICFFAHFSEDGLIHDYVINLIAEIQSVGCDVVLVSSCGKNFKRSELHKLDGKVLGYVIRENFGYDFGSWKTGLENYSQALDDYNSIWFCNDSVYGPFHDLKLVIDQAKGADLWSMTDSFERAHHMQSYFWGVELNSKSLPFVKRFWFHDFKFRSSRDDVIKHYELKLLNQAENEFSLRYLPLFSVSDAFDEFGVENSQSLNLKQINPVHDFAYKLVKEKGFPFIKKELLVSNPRNNPDMDLLWDYIRGEGSTGKLTLEHSGVARGEGFYAVRTEGVR